MNELKALLKQFDVTLRTYNPVNYAKLQSPLPEKDVNQYLESFGLGDNEELKLLFGWKNGFDFSEGEDERYQIFEYGALLSLEHLAEYAKHENEPEFDDNGQRNFLCLTTDGGGEFLMYNMRKKEYGKINLYSVPLFFIEEPISYHDSLSAMIETTIRAYEELIFTYNETEDWLNIDFDKYHALAKTINTNSDYWNEE